MSGCVGRRVRTGRRLRAVASIVGLALLLVAAARKICERRVRHATPEQRRDTALTRHELDVVAQTFAGDPRRFAGLALDTYCP